MKITIQHYPFRRFGWFGLLVVALFVVVRLSWDVLHRKQDKPPPNVSLEERVRIQEEQVRQATEAADAYSRKQLP